MSVVSGRWTATATAARAGRSRHGSDGRPRGRDSRRSCSCGIPRGRQAGLGTGPSSAGRTVERVVVGDGVVVVVCASTGKRWTALSALSLSPSRGTAFLACQAISSRSRRVRYHLRVVMKRMQAHGRQHRSRRLERVAHDDENPKKDASLRIFRADRDHLIPALPLVVTVMFRQLPGFAYAPLVEVAPS